MAEVNVRKSRFDKKLDKIKYLEESGKLKQKNVNRTLRKFLNNKLAIVGAGIFIVILLASIFAPLLTSYDPLKADMSSVLQAPSLDHIFGTDKVGRDVFSRVLYGGRISILIGLGSALGCAIIGVLLGCYGGYKGGWFDKIVLHISEVFMSFPQLVLVLLLVTILGQSLTNLIVIFILTGWGSVYRMARSQILTIREEEYVQSLNAFGLNDFIICYKHMLPNAIGPIVVNITLSTAMFILQEASLSFLGLGVPLEIATWGNILNAAQDMYTLQNSWWLWLPVGIVISSFVMGINFLGDGLRDTTDPTQQG
ncbi:MULTISPECIES: ABC transporter permease [Clostridium]|uniref:Binding-protein-dependent transport system inner membrane protein n=1 Tax=Clostridium carnis TaxID=1530 RepID=A0ABY6SP17_9CLOT|nr:ABC transporter permease [Clostridium carnis]CAI3664946.1 oligopeptide ABC transporter (permease) [Clostridium neonatale]CAI3666649.1 oligopeptide ABC transporter (permease) [Clostridium neonatale]CAI3670886.1 oligopeptide ABC transporter (permease) [Clostridium neonatale]CAI3671591.1 oligopeptide ABC transporter (permease) [Clostridium neonatale]CAI3687717.1 oligopeptide ABC transporter (permease) [Clostridium neonatale]